MEDDKKARLKPWIKYSIYFGIFVGVSFLLAFFRAADHGSLPDFTGYQILQKSQSTNSAHLYSSLPIVGSESSDLNFGRRDEASSSYYSGEITTQNRKEGTSSSPTVLYVWATWCSVCKLNDKFLGASLPFLAKTSIRFLSIEEGATYSEQEMQAYLDRSSLEYPVLMAKGSLLSDLRIAAYPTTIFADSSGKIRFVDTGLMNPISFWLRVCFISLF
jgi:thiol-disulfide isomerase/thioredoxin